MTERAEESARMFKDRMKKKINPKTLRTKGKKRRDSA